MKISEMMYEKHGPLVAALYEYYRSILDEYGMMSTKHHVIGKVMEHCMTVDLYGARNIWA